MRLIFYCVSHFHLSNFHNISISLFLSPPPCRARPFLRRGLGRGRRHDPLDRRGRRQGPGLVRLPDRRPVRRRQLLLQGGHRQLQLRPVPRQEGHRAALPQGRLLQVGDLRGQEVGGWPTEVENSA